MAFARSNTKTASVGNLKTLVGSWSGVSGDASGSFDIKGGRVFLCEFSNFDATSQEDRPTPCDVSESGGTITITVHNHNGVTNGRYIIFYE